MSMVALVTFSYPYIHYFFLQFHIRKDEPLLPSTHHHYITVDSIITIAAHCSHTLKCKKQKTKQKMKITSSYGMNNSAS